MCHGLGCMLLLAGLSAHVTLWASLVRRPHGLEFLFALLSISVGLALVRGVAVHSVPKHRTAFHDAWRWEGWALELIEAVVAAPLYAVAVTLSLPWILRAALRRTPASEASPPR